jgi:Zn finger protein HypA/HybF involved in hydrogenase expression
MKNKENSYPCIWNKFVEYSGSTFEIDHVYYETFCDNLFVAENGENIEENNFKFCPYCGGHIVEVKDEN